MIDCMLTKGLRQQISVCSEVGGFNMNTKTAVGYIGKSLFVMVLGTKIDYTIMLENRPLLGERRPFEMGSALIWTEMYIMFSNDFHHLGIWIWHFISHSVYAKGMHFRFQYNRHSQTQFVRYPLLW